MPTIKQADEFLDKEMEKAIQKSDANDLLYQVAASEDYDPGPKLKKFVLRSWRSILAMI